MEPDDFVFFRNIALSDADTGAQTSTVGEPSLAGNGPNMLLTGNWYATRSNDNGRTWSFISPFNFFPDVDGGFCCDQTVLFEPARGLTIWLLQYITQNGSNTLRLAVNTSPTLDDDNWMWRDLTPANIEPDWAGEWFDYNHAALSDNFLYVGSNAFDVASDRWTRSVILRLPLDNLAGSGALDSDYFDSTQNFSLRCTQGAKDVMYFASHNSSGQLRLFAWPEVGAGVTSRNIDVSRWRAGRYVSIGPDGTNWLTRCDPRITGAWVAEGVIGLMWSVNSLGPSRPEPYVRVVRIDEAGRTVIDEPDIWNSTHAYAYPDAAPNSLGDVGVTLFRGGGALNPDHIVGIRDEISQGWEIGLAARGTNGPPDGKWGDYIACRPYWPDGRSWLASGFTLQGGADLRNVEPRIVHFGRLKNRPSVASDVTGV